MSKKLFDKLLEIKLELFDVDEPIDKCFFRRDFLSPISFCIMNNEDEIFRILRQKAFLFENLRIYFAYKKFLEPSNWHFSKSLL